VKLAITGASGYIGTRLRKLCDQRGIEYRTIDRGQSDQQIVEMLNSFSPNVVVHLASLFVPEHSVHDVANLVHSNIEFGTRVLENMRQSEVKGVVTAGSGWQDGRGESAPNSLYAATKNCFEHIGRFYCQEYGFRMVSLRIFDSAGPEDPRPKLLNTLVRREAEASPLQMSGGEQLIHLVHADDIASGFLLAAERLKDKTGEPFKIFDLRSNQALSLRELVEKLELFLGRKLPIRWGAKPYRINEVMRPFEGRNKLPGWTTRHNLDQIFQDLSKWE